MDNTNPILNSTSPSTAPTPNEEKPILALLAYIPFVFILTVIKKGEDAFHLWHAKNGAGLTAVVLGIWIIGAMLPYPLYSLLSLVNLVIIGVALFSMYKAWNHMQWSIPGVTAWAQNLPIEKWFKPEAHVTQNDSVTPEASVSPMETETSMPEAKNPNPEPEMPAEPQVTAPTVEESTPVESEPSESNETIPPSTPTPPTV